MRLDRILYTEFIGKVSLKIDIFQKKAFKKKLLLYFPPKKISFS